jgi:hypothetical protein
MRELEEYLVSLQTSEYPVFAQVLDDNREAPCPNGCENDLRPVRIPNTYRHILKKGVPPPKVSECTACKKKLTSDEVVDHVTTLALEKLQPEDRLQTGDAFVKALHTIPGGISADPVVRSVQLTKRMRNTQTHAYCHASSCVKHKDAKDCRYVLGS